MVSLLLAVLYLTFTGFGLANSLLGSAWPVMYPSLSVPVSYMGVVTITMTVGTIVASLMADRLASRFGTKRLVILSMAMSALTIAAQSLCSNFYLLCLVAIPYGFAAGLLDAVINNFIAIHYKSRHMSWLHCVWGLGAAISPYIMSYALTSGRGWTSGYLYVALLQALAVFVLLISLPLWKAKGLQRSGESTEKKTAPAKLTDVIRMPGVKAAICSFCFCCAIEQTAGNWASSYLVINNGLAEGTAAACASLVFIGVTAGRALSGFLTMKFSDRTLVRSGQVSILLGTIALLLPFGLPSAAAGLILVGLGVAPFHPCTLHSAPEYFGEGLSQAVIGIEMAGSYVGICVLQPIFGVIADKISMSLFPFYLLLLLALMLLSHETYLKNAKKALTR